MSIINPPPLPEPTVSISSVQPSSANAATAGQIAQGTQSSGQVNSMTKVGSMGQLRKKAPEVYRMMMLGISMTIVQENKRQQDHLKEIWRKARQDAGES